MIRFRRAALRRVARVSTPLAELQTRQKHLREIAGAQLKLFERSLRPSGADPVDDPVLARASRLRRMAENILQQDREQFWQSNLRRLERATVSTLVSQVSGRATRTQTFSELAQALSRSMTRNL